MGLGPHITAVVRQRGIFEEIVLRHRKRNLSHTHTHTNISCVRSLLKSGSRKRHQLPLGSLESLQWSILRTQDADLQVQARFFTRGVHDMIP